MASSISTKPFLSGRCPSSLPGHSGEVAGDADRLPAPPAPRLAHTLIEEPWSPTYLPLGTTAHKQGRIAGETAVGGTAEFAGSLGTQVVKVFELAVARTGLRDQEAAGAGFDPVTVGSVEFDHKAYYPGAHQLHLRITWRRAATPVCGRCSAMRVRVLRRWRR
jgi:NADPH-dependent 2,4-dienoyl-CoA reductase/sulfur reductase-like enzyme